MRIAAVSDRILLPLLALLLLCYSVYRANALSLTHDEALTYTIVKGEGWSVEQTANHHPLNTALMKASYALCGNSELALRLPNLLAHLAYLAFGLLLLHRIRLSAFRFVLFVFLNVNPLLLDFFSLARGYGLAMAALLASIYFLVRAWEENENLSRRTLLFVCLSQAAALCADWANYTLLTVHSGLFTVALLRLYYREGRPVFGKKEWLHAAAFVLLLAMAWRPLLKELFRLKQAGELYYGGTKGFFGDTICSIVDPAWYLLGLDNWLSALMARLAAILLIAAALIVLLRFRRKVQYALPEISLVLFAFYFLQVMVQAFFFNGLYPRDRTALALIPLGTLLVFSALDSLQEKKWLSCFFVSLALLQAASGLIATRPHATLSWAYDQHSKKYMAEFAAAIKTAPAGKKITGAASWQLIPVLNYYRERYGLQGKIEPFSRSPVDESNADWLYVMPEDLALVDKSKYEAKETNRYMGPILFRRIGQ